MPPVVVAAGIGAAASIGGGMMAARGQKKAAKKSAEAADRTAQMNNALQRETYNRNSTMLQPYVTRGNEAGSAINSLLGISGTVPAAPAAPVASTQQYGAPILASSGRGAFAGGLGDAFGERIIRAARGANGLPASTPPIVPDGTVTNPNGAYQNAFQNYLNSTGYQFQVGEGQKAINQGYAAQGSLQSGAALKALQTYGQNTATGFFKDYLGLLANQQGVGLTGASSVAGVGQNYANSVSANNNNAMQQQISSYGDRANANTALWGNIAGGIQGVANAFGSSYRR